MWADGEQVDVVRSGGQSPSLGKPIGTTFLPAAQSKIGTEFEVDCRGAAGEGGGGEKPFYTKGQCGNDNEKAGGAVGAGGSGNRYSHFPPFRLFRHSRLSRPDTMPIRIAILTISDAGSRGERPDTCGDAIAAWAAGARIHLSGAALVPDETGPDRRHAHPLGRRRRRPT